MKRTLWPRTLSLGAVAAAVVLAALLLLPSGESAPEASQAGRAERLVLRVLQRNFPDARRASCRRSHKRAVAVCRWRAKRVLSPSRVRHCKGRFRVELRSERAVIVPPRRRRCEMRVGAVDPKFGFSDISIGLGRASPDQAARLAEGVGAGLFRLHFDWRYAEPVRDQYVLDLYDRAYDALLARGIRPLFTLAGAPRWAWPLLVTCPGDCFVPPARHFDGEWREMAAILAKRYPRAAGIEIWNEPNEFSFWTTGPDPVRYAELLDQAYDAIKKEDPNMTVVGGVGNREDSEDGSLPALRFLRDVFAQGGHGSVDALAVHPYVERGRLGDVLPQLDAARALSAEYDRPNLPLWVTEFGFTTTGPDEEVLKVSEAEQAANLVQVYKTLRSQPDVRTIIFQSLIDWYDDPSQASSGYGIVRGDLSPKPAYCALHKAVGVPGRCPE